MVVIKSDKNEVEKLVVIKSDKNEVNKIMQPCMDQSMSAKGSSSSGSSSVASPLSLSLSTE